MKDSEIIKELKNFTAPEESRRTLWEVAIKDGIAYATDGRIGVAAKLSEPHRDDVPDDFPLDSLKGIVDGAKKQTKWSVLDPIWFRKLNEQFREKWRNAISEARADYNERYVESECPSCGETLYWDKDKEEIVREKEAQRDIRARDITMPTMIEFADDDGAVVNFPFLHILDQAFGSGFMRFAPAKNEEGNPMLYMMSVDANVYGAVMPWRIDRKEDGPECVLGTIRSIV